MGFPCILCSSVITNCGHKTITPTTIQAAAQSSNYYLPSYQNVYFSYNYYQQQLQRFSYSFKFLQQLIRFSRDPEGRGESEMFRPNDCC